MKTLIVVDMQNDFIDGSLGTREAQAIVPKVKEKIKEYQERGDEIIFTRDTHQSDILTHRRERSFRWNIASKAQRAGRLQKV